MKKKILGLLAVGLLTGPMAAIAVPIDYTITFTTDGGIAPTSGFFTYDSDIPAFSDFLVVWNSTSFDLTADANAPFVSGSGCGFGSGAAASFAFLNSPASSACNADWTALAFDGVATFYFEANFGAEGISISDTNYDADVGEFVDAVGLWRIAPVMSVPVPGTLMLLGLGLAGLGFSRRRKA